MSYPPDETYSFLMISGGIEISRFAQIHLN